MDYVDKISRCSIATNIPISLSPACQEAISQELGYNVCVNRHKNEEDFYLLDQRVYLKYGSELWRNDREIIELIDESGFIVDYIEY